MTTEYMLDGTRIASLESFYDEISRVLIPNCQWGRNLDALNDVLRGGFGTPNDGFTLRWHRAALSMDRLGYPETVRHLEASIACCHDSHRDQLERLLADARAGVGATVFDWLIEIIKDHGPGGTQAADNVRLILD